MMQDMSDKPFTLSEQCICRCGACMLAHMHAPYQQNNHCPCCVELFDIIGSTSTSLTAISKIKSKCTFQVSYPCQQQERAS